MFFLPNSVGRYEIELCDTSKNVKFLNRKISTGNSQIELWERIKWERFSIRTISEGMKTIWLCDKSKCEIRFPDPVDCSKIDGTIFKPELRKEKKI